MLAPLTSNTAYYFVVLCRGAAGNRSLPPAESMAITFVSFGGDIIDWISQGAGDN